MRAKQVLGHENNYCKCPKTKTGLDQQNHEVLQFIKWKHLLSRRQYFHARKWYLIKIKHTQNVTAHPVHASILVSKEDSKEIASTGSFFRIKHASLFSSIKKPSQQNHAKQNVHHDMNELTPPETDTADTFLIQISSIMAPLQLFSMGSTPYKEIPAQVFTDN